MRIRNLALAGLAGAALAYFFDPVAGSARRNRLRDRLSTFMPGRPMRHEALAPLPENVAPSPARAPNTMVVDTPKTRPGDASALPEDQDDAAIARKIQLKLKERSDLEAANLVIDVVRGVAYLRGDLNDRQKFEEIVDLTGSVPGVRRVQSLLHLPESETVSRPVTRPLGDAWNG
jgi:hypothetical protein